MKCQFCNQELPDGANFCYRCNKQIVCIGCKKLLLENSPICVYCGQEIKNITIQANINHIKYSETGTGKTFEASFSDETAGNVVDVFAQFLPINRAQQQSRPFLQIQNPEETYAEEVEGHPANDINTQKNNSAIEDINKIFSEKNGTIILFEKRLKAKSKMDHQSRVCLLFLLYLKQKTSKDINREELSAFMSREKLNDGNFRSWFSKHKSYFVIDNNTIELSPEGEEIAKGILKEVFDSSIEGVWSSNNSTTNLLPKATSKQKPPQIVKDLDLSPKDNVTLDHFLEQYKFKKTAPQLNLLFVYYLKQVLKINIVTQNHIFTCYRHTKIKIPNNLYTTLVDTISKKGWLENVSNLNITILGINEVEQKMKIK